jgi:hypothetical protein
MGVVQPTSAHLAALNPDALQAQADTLLNKRLHELNNLLPRTIGMLGPEGRSYILRFASDYWPTGHLRHLEDAWRFCDFLKIKGISICQSEYNWVRFIFSRKRASVHWVRDFDVRGKSRFALQFLYWNRNGVPQEFGLYSRL